MTASRHRLRRRRGAILLVVLALLALFAVIGLSFVLYAESAGTAARLHREEKDNRSRQRPDPAAAAGLAVNQIVFGPVDPTSAIRGHDLATLMYGVGGTTPYNGVGLIHEQLDIPTGGRTNLQIDRAEVLYHGLLVFDRPNPLDPSAPVIGAVVDPGYTQGNTQVRNGDLVAGTLPDESTLTSSPWVYVPKNAPYTYPDVNNALVAAADPTAGRVFIPSAHRPRLFFPAATANDWFGSPDATLPNFNPNWFTPAGRLKVLRPRRIDNLTAAERAQLRQKGLWPVPVNPTPTQLSQLANALADGPNGLGKFPNPAVNPDGSYTGDVPNYKFGTGVQRNDSVWLDLGLPTQDYKGKRLAPLVAITLLPLDGRVNLSASGNLKGSGGTHTSNMGFGPHEINPGAVLQTPASGTTFTQTKYGANATPAPPGVTASLPTKPFSTVPPSAASQVDWAGDAPAGWLTLPGAGTASPLAGSPTYTVPTGPVYPASPGNLNTAGDKHPALWSAVQRASFATSDPTTPGQKAFPLTDLRLFAGRYSGKTSDYNTQTFLDNSQRVGSAFQTEFDNGASPFSARARALVTPFSVGFAKGGLSPNWFGTQSFAMPAPTVPIGATAGATVPGLAAAPQLDVTAVAGSSPALSDERQRGYPFANPVPSQVRVQNLRAALGAVNLNRPLADYRTNTTQPLAAAGNVTPTTEATAWNDRQQLAADIFIRLCVATGAKIAFDSNIPDDQNNLGQRVPADAKLPYSDNVQRSIARRAGLQPVTVRSGYVLPQPTGYDTATNQTTYTLFVNPAPQFDGSMSPGSQTPVSKQEYDALRYLAQLAANIVDQVDADDVSTAFVWNPTVPAITGYPYPLPPQTGPQPVSLVPLAPADRLSNAYWKNSMGSTFAASTPIAVEERTVFGVEKPRLVINEAYAEVANDPADKSGTGNPKKATKDFRVRFWFELLNPSPQETANTLLAGPDNTNAANAGAVPLVMGTTSVYRLQVFDKGTKVLNQLARSGNVTGAVNTDQTLPDPSDQYKIKSYSARDTSASAINTNSLRLQADFVTRVATAAGSGAFVEANNAQPAASGTNRYGFAVVGPDVPTGDQYTSGVKAFIPDTGTAPYNLAIRKQPQASGSAGTTATDDQYLDYYVKLVSQDSIQTQVMDRLNKQDPNRHTVLLQRLANPYLGFDADTNPYVTVDVMSQIEVQNAIQFGSDAPATGANAATPEASRASVGRVQPLAGFQNFVTGGAGDTLPTYEYPIPTQAHPTLALKQTGTDNTNPEKLTFFRHNYQTAPPAAGTPTTPSVPGGETLLAPFDWLAHFDRPLVNPVELFHATALPAHLLTRRFLTPVASSATVARHTHDLQHRDPNQAAAAPYFPNDGPLFQRDQQTTTQAFVSPLYRALDLLQTKPWTNGVPTDGRQSGKINLNMIWDGDQTTTSKVFRAVLDSQPGNGFSAADVDTLWRAVVKSRSPLWKLDGTGTVSTTADELGAAGTGTLDSSSGQNVFDRPFKGLGAGLFTGSAGSGVGVTYPTAGGLATQFQAQPFGLEDTLLRRKVQPGAADPTPYPSGLTGLFQTPTAPTPGQPTHPYQQWEPLRKAFNSFTTTSDSFVLMMTVGFFEVVEEPDPAGRPSRVLRQEFYDDAPGDLRAQYVAVLDRTGIATDLNAANQPQTAQQPWTLEVQNSVGAGATPAAPVASAPVELPMTVGKDATWNGTTPANAPRASELLYNTNKPSTANPEPDGSRFYFITPKFTRDGSGNIISGPQVLSVGGTYEGVPFTITATSTPAATDTRFFLGAGDRAEQVQASFDTTNPAKQWSYNPTTGVARLTVASVTQPHDGGGVASNVVFRSPGPQPSKTLKPGQTDPVVRMFGELK